MSAFQAAKDIHEASVSVTLEVKVDGEVIEDDSVSIDAEIVVEMRCGDCGYDCPPDQFIDHVKTSHLR